MRRLQPGEKIGTCKIESFVAEGGMAIVYRANQELMHKTVALKVLREQFLSNREALAAFLKEGMAGARLSHPSIAQVYYTAEQSGIYYIVMDFIHGQDLKSICKKHGLFSPRRALEITRKVAEILAFAHDRGIVHRDIKPANIMLSSEGEVVLTDFGIAALLQDKYRDPTRRSVWGTPPFMSPEQCSGKLVDHRSDLYSLGATLYNLLSGSPPFKKTSKKTILQQVLEDKPASLREILPHLPRKTSALVDRLLAKKPEERYQSARDVVAVIDEIFQGGAAPGPSAPRITKEFVWRRAFWFPVLVAVAAVWLFGLCLFFLLSWWPSPERSAMGLSPGEPTIAIPQPQPKSGLKTRIEELCSSLETGRLNQALELMIPSSRQNPGLLSSLVSIFQDLKPVPAGFQGKYEILAREESQANIVLLYAYPRSQGVVQILLKWIRAADGNWYVEPDPQSGKIRHIVHGPLTGNR